MGRGYWEANVRNDIYEFSSQLRAKYEVFADGALAKGAVARSSAV